MSGVVSGEPPRDGDNPLGLELLLGGPGRPAGELIDALGLAEADLVLLDEPPGHLGSFAFARIEGGRRRWVRVNLLAAEELICYRCAWSMAAIRAARISMIRIGRDVLCLRPERTFPEPTFDAESRGPRLRDRLLALLVVSAFAGMQYHWWLDSRRFRDWDWWKPTPVLGPLYFLANKTPEDDWLGIVWLAILTLFILAFAAWPTRVTAVLGCLAMLAWIGPGILDIWRNAP